MLIALGFDHRGKNMACRLLAEGFFPRDPVTEDSAVKAIRQALFDGNGENSFSGAIFDERNGESIYQTSPLICWDGAFLLEGDLLKDPNKFIGHRIEFLECPKYLSGQSPARNNGQTNGTFVQIDYPDVAAAVAEKVSLGEVDFGILIDATGIGMSIVANKFHGVRAAVCYNEMAAELSRRHNNANVLCLPGEMLGKLSLSKMVTLWLSTSYEGERHQGRLNKIELLEEKTGL